MILFCLYFAFLAGNPLIKVIEKGNRRIVLNVSFGEEKKEPINIGFILSPVIPSFDYRLINSDTSEIKETAVNNNPVEIGCPINLMGYNLFPVLVHSNFTQNNRKINVRKMDLRLNFESYQDINLPQSLGQVFKNLILNYEDNPQTKPKGLLIITPNSFYNAVLPLADWKEKKGYRVTIARLAETGNTPSAIKNYIANAYHNWNPPLEYVILIGDKDSLPAYSYAAPVGATDYPYTLIDGDDFLAELLIGRISVATISELDKVVAKILGYERNPYTGETQWYERALVVGANMPVGMTTPIPVKRWVREKLIEYGINTVDTVFYPMAPSNITNSINQGVLFVNYRSGEGDPDGWPFPLFKNTEVYALNNGWKLPIVTSITCYTGNFQAEPCFGEAWLRAGANPSNPKGAVGFIGASAASTSSRWNNCLDYGIYWGILKEEIYNLGPALYRGKLEVYMNFPAETTWNSGSSFYFHTYNLLGDPSLEIWTDVPQNFVVNHQMTIPVGTNSFSVQVLNSSSQPVKGAMVSLYKKNETKEIDFTDAGGLARFQITTSTPDTLFVTVTKHNFKPYCGYALVNNSGVYVGYYSHTISDPGGNNNGEINPGETINLSITLKNFGNSMTASNVSAKLSTTDPLITITDSIKNYGSINPGATVGSSPFIFNVSQNIKNNHPIKFNLTINSSQGNWSSVLWLIAKAAEFEYQRQQVLDGGNGVLEPGETSDLTIFIKNIGGLMGTNISGILRSLNPGISVIDSLGSFGNIPLGDSATNSSNHFRIGASSQLAPGHEIKFITMLSGDNNFKDTVEFSIIIGVVNANTPTGPDGYGYYAYDNTDAGYPEAPTYNWIEIDPELGGAGTILNLLNDETKTINLPFNFKFYGIDYNKISISSNGYVAMDSTWIADMYNWRIPAAGGPPLLIAPFWDDLDPNATDSSGNVCYHYDGTNHRFLVEWSRIQHLHNPIYPTPAELQTFEVILLDPIYYPTQTGDGEILFQYKKITNDDTWHNYATVGIEDKNHINGLEYTYANIYPPSAAILANNRAIKFTTDQPDPFPGVGESNLRPTIYDRRLSVYPNPFRDYTVIKYALSPMHYATNNKVPSASSLVPIIRIYDVTGRLVKDFSRLTIYDLHPTQILWFGDDNSGCKLPAGIYFIEVKYSNNWDGAIHHTNNISEVQKIILRR